MRPPSGGSIQPEFTGKGLAVRPLVSTSGAAFTFIPRSSCAFGLDQAMINTIRINPVKIKTVKIKTVKINTKCEGSLKTTLSPTG